MNLVEAQDWVQFMERTIAQVSRELQLERVARPLLDDLALVRINANRWTYELRTRESDEEEEIQAVYLLIDALSAVYARFIVPAALLNGVRTSRIHRDSRSAPSSMENVSELFAVPTYAWSIYSAEQSTTLARSFTLMLDATIEKIYETSDPFTAQRANNLIRNYFLGSMT